MATDINVSQLIINKLTQAQYDEAKAAGNISESELYFVTDDGEVEIADVIAEHNTSADAHADIRASIPSIAGLATEQYVNDVADTKTDKAFSNVVVGSTTIVADSKDDSLTIEAGDGISVSGDATNDKVTITNSGVRSIDTGSANGTISVNTNGASVNVAVKGLGSAAYTESTAYDAAGTAKTKADEALALAKEYTNTKTTNMATTGVVDNKISVHNTSTSAHNDIRDLISGLTDRLNALADSDDTTLDQMSEIVAYIKSNKDLIDSITTNKVNVSDIINNLTTNVSNKPLSAAQGVAIKGLIDALQDEFDDHTHAIADVTGLQTALDGKAASSHGTHVSYSTTAPVMDGTASVGSASTVARSDHKHPTDTSRAAKSDFDSHTGNTTVHITATERTNWNAAKTHADSSHAPSNAEKNQNAFSNIAVSGQTTVAADSVTDTVTFAGINVSITTDATNDKVTFAVADGTTSSKGVVQLTNSTSSTSTTTAATPSSVKAAYDLANSKQDKFTGTEGQIVGFDADGNAVAQYDPVINGDVVIAEIPSDETYAVGATIICPNALSFGSIDSETLGGDVGKDKIVIASHPRYADRTTIDGVTEMSYWMDDAISFYRSTGSTSVDIRLQGVATPTANNHAANKKYVDDAIAAAIEAAFANIARAEGVSF